MTDPIMFRRLSACRCTKLVVMVAAILCVFALYLGQNGILDRWHWFYHSWTLLSFSHRIIILNASSSTIHHPIAPPYPHPYTFLINQPEKCRWPNPFLVLLVNVESYDGISRKTIRETWGDVSNYKDVDILRLFLVGQPPVMTSAVQRLLEEESAKYGDIIQQDFVDTYNNLTLKTLMGMEWVIKFCPNASYVMKIDNDVFLNVDYLIHHLLHPELPARQNYLTGFLVSYTGPIREKMSKWYIPEELYPGDTYPPYPSGPGYVFSGDMARKIYQVAQGIRVISIEDAFIGMCLYRLNIPPTRSPRNMFRAQKINYNARTFCNVVIVHHYEKDNLRNVWLDFWDKKTRMC
ncbi:PREDICTED: beta-1,3-galactosyltransferase 1-like [Nanorana parkeri]|uniref:beta-1,3-galactosyltransferase 1-like n=1 Tax=Nanorana parkeri TaxID=125878 RepID=UPI000854F98F|nr:PREDICTED: beta-1,3-galactosyltransferase 1-like [Nanorana parkeri]